MGIYVNVLKPITDDVGIKLQLLRVQQIRARNRKKGPCVVEIGASRSSYKLNHRWPRTTPAEQKDCVWCCCRIDKRGRDDAGFT